MHPVRRRTRWTVALTVTGLAAAGLAAGAGGPAAAVPPPTPPTPSTAAGAAAAPVTVQAQDTPGPVTGAQGPLDGALAARDRLPGRTVVAVRFRSGVKAGSATRATAFAGAVRRLGATTRSTADGVGAATFVVPDGGVDAFVAEMRARPDVAEARVATLYSPTLVPDDPQYATRQKAYLTTSGLPTAWSLTKGSASVRIAVVDTGVDVGHPDLAGKVVSSWNTVSDSTDVTDEEGHGTFVAGVAGAATNNAKGIAGAGFDSSIIAVKVADPSGFMADVDVAEGIRWAADHDADVINISLGSTSGDADTQAAVAYARGKGVLVVASAGNAGQEGNPKIYPAAYPGVVAVGATDGKGHRAWFSEHGTWVTMAAPGVDIRGTSPRAGSRLFPANYATGNGTSFSAPLVAGAAALLWARSPGATAAQVRSALVSTASGFSGFGLGSGELDARKALETIIPSGKPTVTNPAADSTWGDTVLLKASTGVPRSSVAFHVDGVRVAWDLSVADLAWDSNGWADGTYTVEARSCNLFGVCAADGTSRQITIAQPVPLAGGIVDGATVSGGREYGVADGGGKRVAVYVDGVKHADNAFGSTPEINFSAVEDGTHTIEATVCSKDGRRCDGPRSVARTVTSRSLHPTLGTVTNRVFSPDADGTKDTTTVRYTLERRQDVTIVVRDAAGNRVRTVARTTKPAGTYAFTWNGKKNDGTAAPSGTYAVRVQTVAPDDTTLKGLVKTTVRVDRSSPKLTSVSGAGATIYPAKDGYKDTFRPAVTVSESSTVTLRIRNAAGTVVRSFSASRNAGRASFTWDGRRASGTRVPAGAYSWTFTATDASGRSTTTSKRSVAVKNGTLTTRTVTLTKVGDAAYAGGGSDTCARAVTTGSTYARGLWLKNNCARSNPQNALAFYKFKVPAAVSYTSVKVVTTGRSHSAPGDVVGGVFGTQVNDYDITPTRAVSGTATKTLTLGTITGPGHAPKRVVDVVVFVPNERAPLVDWDVKSVKVVVTYQVVA